LTDLIVPIARVVDVAVVYEDQIPLDMQGQLSGSLRGAQQVADFAHAIGRNKMPKRPLMVYGPDNGYPILVIGDGVTEAAEMQDLAQEALGKQEENVRKHGRAFDFDEARERHGMVRREDFGKVLSDALQRNVDYLKRNQVTDPRGRYMNA
jgi:hypothetical protein